MKLLLAAAWYLWRRDPAIRPILEEAEPWRDPLPDWLLEYREPVWRRVA